MIKLLLLLTVLGVGYLVWQDHKKAVVIPPTPIHGAWMWSPDRQTPLDRTAYNRDESYRATDWPYYRTPTPTPIR